MLDKKETQKTLEYFNKYVIQQSRTNLTKKGHNDTSELYKSLDYKLSVHKNSFSNSFLMENYGKFLDKGVRGAGGVRKSLSFSGRVERYESSSRLRASRL